MSNPPPYLPSFSFSGYQQTNPTSPLPGPMVDNELANVSDSLNTTITALFSVRRSDGALQNGIVTPESLASDITIGVQTPTAWVTAHAYTAGNIVVQTNKFYLCLMAHTSGVFATDLAALKWVEVTLSITGYSADQVTYDHTISGLTAVNVKTAIDEVDADVDVLQALNVSGTPIAAAATVDIGASTGEFVHVTGSGATIVGFGTKPAGTKRTVLFEGVNTLVNSAALSIQGGANIVTAANDTAEAVSEGSGNWRVNYERNAFVSKAQAWEVISEQSVSGVASVSWTGLGAYRRLRLSGWARPATDSVSPRIRTDANGGASYDSGAADYGQGTVRGTATTLAGVAGLFDAIYLSSATTVGNTGQESVWLNIEFFEFNKAQYGFFAFQAGYLDASSGVNILTGAGERQDANGRDALQFTFSSGNIAFGYFTLEGVKG